MGNFGYNQAQPSPSPHPAPNVLPPHIGTSFPAAFPCSFLLPRDLPSAAFPWSRQPGALKCPQAGGRGTHVPGIPSQWGEAARAGVPPGKRVGIALLKHPRCPLAKGGAVGHRVWGLPSPSYQPCSPGASRGSPSLHPPAWQRPIRGGRAVALATPRCHSSSGWRRRGWGWWQRGQWQPVGRCGAGCSEPSAGGHQARGPPTPLGHSNPSPQPMG